MLIKISYNFGDAFREIESSIKMEEKNIESQINALGSATADKMKEIINTNKKRPQSGEPTVLEDNIDVENFPDNAGWGVGNIEQLNKNAKHWRVVNLGSNHMVGEHLPPGIFEPGNPIPSSSDSRSGRWKKNNSDNRSYSPIIKNPIPPMNYIQKTVNFLRRKINDIKLKGK